MKVRLLKRQQFLWRSKATTEYRALTKPAEIYFFDDSFSALDYQADANLRRALKEYTKDAAVIIMWLSGYRPSKCRSNLSWITAKWSVRNPRRIITQCQTLSEFASSQGMGVKDE